MLYNAILVWKPPNDKLAITVVLYVKEHGSITNREYQDLTAASKRTGSRDLENLVSQGVLENLVSRGVLEKIGQTGRGTRYVLSSQKGAKGATKGSETGQTRSERRAKRG